MPRWYAGRSVVLWSALAICGAAPASAQQQPPPEWQPNGRVNAYVRSMVGPWALFGIALNTLEDQISTEEPIWGDNTGGLARRLASNAGRSFVQETARHGLAAVLDRSVVYQPCTCREVGARVGHAFAEVITDRTREGRRVIALSRFVGAYAGAFAEQAWRPDKTSSDVALAGVNAIVSGTISNLWKEFVNWP